MKIYKNSAQCLMCLDVIESRHTHDFVTCKCGNLAVDGGLDYLRRVGQHLDQVKELSIMEPKPYDPIEQ